MRVIRVEVPILSSFENEKSCIFLKSPERRSAAVPTAAFAEKYLKGKCQIKYVGCMRLCGKGPNVKYDGKLYHKADEALLRSLTDEERKL